MLVAALIVVPTVAAAKAPGPMDITATSKGHDLKAAAAARFAAYGATDAPLRVLKLGDGDYVVAPESLIPVATATKQANGKTLYTTEVTIGGDPSDEGGPLLASAREPSSADVAEMAAPYWQMWQNGCFARIPDNAGYFDTCYKLYKLINDGVAGKIFYALHHWGSADAYSGQTIDWAEIWSDQASPSLAMAWSDWGPRDDLSQGQGNCTQWGVNVGIIVQVSATYTACEKWDHTKYSDAAHYKMKWSCNCFLGVEAARSVAYMTEITTTDQLPQPYGPRWVIGASFDG